MSRMHPVNPRLDELLFEQAVEGLDPAGEQELQRLAGGSMDPLGNAYLQTAAITQLALHQVRGSGTERMPAALRQRLLQSAVLPGGSSDTAVHKAAPNPARVVNLKSQAARKAAGATAPLQWRPGWRDLGWALAAVLAMVLLTPRTSLEISDPAAARAQLLSSTADVITVGWAQPDDPAYAAVTGDVVWSDQAQAGYMRLRGLPANNPDEAQYQLWIVDPERSAQPVDGGVFNMPAHGGQAIIPIDAKLPVSAPAAFAITLEKPGGVVVSAGPLLVVAAAG